MEAIAANWECATSRKSNLSVAADRRLPPLQQKLFAPFLRPSTIGAQVRRKKQPTKAKSKKSWRVYPTTFTKK